MMLRMADQSPTISTHVLDVELGVPAAGMPVALFRLDQEGRPQLIAEAETDDDGRIGDLLAGTELEEGDYQVAFDVEAYREEDEEIFFQSVALAIHVGDVSRGYHVPLLLSPYGLTTYRGS